MNCPKKKNSVNTNKSNIKNKNCIWEKVSALQKFHGGKVLQGPDKPPSSAFPPRIYSKKKKNLSSKYLNYKGRRRRLEDILGSYK